VKPWQERFPDKYAVERAFWLGQGFEEARSDRGTSFKGAVSVTAKPGGEDKFEHRSFEVQIDYPAGYPYVSPAVTFLDPPVRRARHQGRDGNPCLFPPSEWSRDFPASEFHAALERWLGYYIVGEFPRELATYELPEYYGDGSLSVLIAEGTTAAIKGKQRGTFSVRQITGLQLGVLWSIDQQQVGRPLLEALAFRKQEREVLNGRWYRLDAEPPLMKGTVDLTALLKANGHEVNLGQRRNKKQLIALIFDDSALGEERLFVLEISATGPKQKYKPATGWLLLAPPAFPVSHAELFRRLEGVRDTTSLDQTKVAIFGLGAIGSHVALALAREAVGSLVLCDPDILKPGNVMRHALDLSSAGEYKALAVEEAVRRINPYGETQPELSGLFDPGNMEVHVRGAQLVIAAIGDDVTEAMLSEVLCSDEDSPPMLLVRTLHAGDAFRVALIRPGVDACFACLATYRHECAPEFIEVPADGLQDIFDDGCAAAARPGAGLTSQHAATFTADRALDVLEGRAAEVNHWLWIERGIPDGDERIALDMTLHASTFKPLSDCPVCGN
jgi:hypothetical protein